MTERDRLVEILKVPIYPKIGVDPAEVVADYLLAKGVIVAPMPRAELIIKLAVNGRTALGIGGL